jgi:hypothetical protein
VFCLNDYDGREFFPQVRLSGIGGMDPEEKYTQFGLCLPYPYPEKPVKPSV